MKRTLLKKYWLTLTSSLAVGTGIILACGGDWEPDYNSMASFTAEAFVDSSYRPFFYTGASFYYDESYDNKHDIRFNESNINDWVGYLGNAASRTELEHLLRIASQGSIDSAAAFVTGKQKVVPASMQSFQLFKNNDKKAAAFLAYLSLAKKSEVFAVNNLEYEWDYDSKKKDVSFNAAPLEKQLLQEFTQQKDLFLKERYWFQLERSYFFNNAPQVAVDLFEKNEKMFAKNVMYYRTMAYAAGAYRKLNNYSKANYYYSKVYDGCIPLKRVAHYSFHPQEEADWKATLALCTNNEEKATLWQILGIFYSDAKRAMQEIYTLDPRSEKLDLLLARAVSIEASRLNGWNPPPSGNEIATKDSIDTELIGLITRYAQAANTNKPYLWYMAAGYLYMLDNKTDKAAAFYKQAEKKLPKDELVQGQLRLFKLVNTIASVSNADAKLEKSILPDLTWLTSGKLPKGLGAEPSLTWIKQALGSRYKTQGEQIKAVCFNNYGDFYSDDKNIEALKSFLTKPNKSPYESIYAKLYQFEMNDLLEYQAIQLTYQDKLSEAIAKIEPGASNEVLPGNPFNGRLQDCHDCDHEAPQKIKYTKLSLLKKMKDIEDKVKTGTDVYTNAMLLANAFYNITWYGNARAFYDCRVYGSINGGVSGQNAPSNMKLAIKYYTQALSVAKTDEQKAKCHFMLAKCERNGFYVGDIVNSKDTLYAADAKPDFLPWDGFIALKQKYSNTQFYKEAIRECGYFKTYTRK